MIPDIDRPAWYADAACVGEDPELFFPERGEETLQAKIICFGCPVRAECQEHGIRHEHIGIWGGLSERERRRRRKQLGIESDPVWSEQQELIDEIDTRSRGGASAAELAQSLGISRRTVVRHRSRARDLRKA